METIEESESVGSFSKDPPQLVCSQVEPLSPVPQHDPHASDLNNLTQLDGEFQNKLDLKDVVVDETDDKGSNFEVSVEQSSDEAVALESGEGQVSDHDNHDVDNGGGGGGWNGDGEGSNWVENVNEKVGGDDGWNGGDEGCNWNEKVGDDGWNDGWNENGNEKVGDDGWNDGWNENGNEKVGGDGWNDGGDDGWNGGVEVYNWNDNGNNLDGGEVENRDERSSGRANNHNQFPLRPEAEDCSFYLRTGDCKFGFNCRFNHPIRRRNQVVKEKVGERDEMEERSGQTECKYYSRSGGCKYGKACKFNHTRGKSSAAPVLEINFLGLPIRLGEKECPYYMRTGSCKFGASCKFNHPDPTTVGGSDSISGYGNGSSISLQGVSQSSIPSWSSTRTVKETAPFVPIMLSPTPGVSPRSSDWNGYQAPVYLSERSMHRPSTYAVNKPAIETNVYMHHQKPMREGEFPERPGEPECSYFIKTGDCKFRSNCKFHHPKNRSTRLPPCNLSDKGLPLRPDQIVCTHYSRYGICKFGPACKFDHPINPPPPTMPGLDQQSSYTNSASVDVAGIGSADDATIQDQQFGEGS